MEFRQRRVEARGERIGVEVDGREVARAYLYILRNDLHPAEPFGLLEDVFVEEDMRAQKIATVLVQEVIKVAQQAGCYKLIATSRHARPHVHKIYEGLGFQNWGFEFRMSLGA